MSTDLRHMRAFIAVAEERHFGRAARRLSITQPPLSQQIRALEESVGALLFARTRRSVQLTPVGRELLVEVRRIVAMADALPPLAQSLARGERGMLSLAFVSTADYGLLPPLLRAFGARFPQVRLQLTEATSDVQSVEILAGRIDAGLAIPPLTPLPPESSPVVDATNPAARAPGLSYRPLFREPLIVAMSTQVAASLHAAADLAGRGASQAVDLRALADLPLIIFPRRLAPAFHDLITGSYTQAGLVPRIAQEAIQMQTIVSLVSAGLGIALVPRSLKNLRRTGVVYRPLAGALPAVETGVVWRSDDASPVLRGFLDVAEQTAATLKAGRRA
ncbi:MAG: LysR family transcriptional regulator [Janthinobacterium lividum]